MNRSNLAFALTALFLAAHVFAEALPAELTGLWSNSKPEAFTSFSLAVSPDGRGFLLAAMGRVPATWRYAAATKTLTGTVISDESATKGQTLGTLEVRLDPERGTLTITGYKGIEELASLKGEEFNRKAAQIPEDLKKLL